MDIPDSLGSDDIDVSDIPPVSAPNEEYAHFIPKSTPVDNTPLHWEGETGVNSNQEDVMVADADDEVKIEGEINFDYLLQDYDLAPIEKRTVKAALRYLADAGNLLTASDNQELLGRYKQLADMAEPLLEKYVDMRGDRKVDMMKEFRNAAMALKYEAAKDRFDLTTATRMKFAESRIADMFDLDDQVLDQPSSVYLANLDTMMREDNGIAVASDDTEM